MNRIGFDPNRILKRRFQRLSFVQQALYFNILARVDAAGVWEVDIVEFEGEDGISMFQVKQLEGQGLIKISPCQRFVLIPDFPEQHYTKPSEKAPTHRQFFKKCEQHSLYVSKDLKRISFVYSEDTPQQIQVQLSEDRKEVITIENRNILERSSTDFNRLQQSSTLLNSVVREEKRREEKRVQQKGGIGGKAITAAGQASSPDAEQGRSQDIDAPLEQQKTSTLEFQYKQMSFSLSSASDSQRAKIEKERAKIMKVIKSRKCCILAEGREITDIARFAATQWPSWWEQQKSHVESNGLSLKRLISQFETRNNQEVFNNFNEVRNLLGRHFSYQIQSSVKAY